MDTSGGRSWHDDQSAINDLAHDFDHNQLRHQLMEAKYDVTQLSAFDLIRKVMMSSLISVIRFN